MAKPLLHVQHLTTQMLINGRLINVVEDLSFALFPGKTLALVGESGSGKTMTALSIMRILPMPPALPSQGNIFFRERDLLQLSEKEMRRVRGARISMIFQDPISALNPVMTVGDQILEVVELHLGLSEEAAVDRVLKMLNEVQIANPHDCMNAYPHQLSGGMKQRVMIAMSLVCEPDLLIADEPTTAIDVTIQAQILSLIKELQQRHHMALLLITHDMDVVAKMADEVIVMYASQMMEKGSRHQLFSRLAHPYTEGLFNSRPTPEIPRGKLHAIPGNVPHPGNYPKGCRFHPRCPYVMDKCRSGEVPYFSVDQDSSHIALCWLYDGSEESASKQKTRYE